MENVVVASEITQATTVDIVVVQPQPAITQAAAAGEPEDMGFFQICGETRKLIFNRRKLYSQITITMILPLALTIFVKRYISLEHKFNNLVWLIIDIVQFFFLLAFSILATSSIVRSTIAHEIMTYRQVVSTVVPNRRILITLLCGVVAFLAYYIAFLLTVALWSELYDQGPRVTKTGERVLLGVLIVYILGLVYMVMVWQMAAVISVVEDVKGFEAMLRGRRLIRGKFKVSALMSGKLVLGVVGIARVFDTYAHGSTCWKALGYGCVCALLLTVLVLFELVLQTVIYRVCKSYEISTSASIGHKSSFKNYLECIYWGITGCVVG